MIMEYRNTIISVKALKSIIGDALYKRLAAGILKYCPPLVDGEEPSVFVDSIPLSNLSRETRAAIFNMSEKKARPATKSRKGKLGKAERDLLQDIVDERCRMVTDHYLTERDRLSREYLQDMMKPEFRAALSQYPVPGTDPRTVLYCESFDSLYRGHHDEMRRLLCICETLGLRTNPLLGRVLGCNAQPHKGEPQAGRGLL